MISLLTANNLFILRLGGGLRPFLPNVLVLFHRAHQAVSPMTDDQCIRGIASGKEEPFQVLFHKYGSLVLGTCCRYLSDKSLAEDASQDVWVKVIRAAKKYKAKGKCRAWILQITRNTCLSLLRKNRPEKVELNDQEVACEKDVDLAQMLAGKEDRELIKELIDGLPTMQRAALVMQLSEDSSYREVAKSLKTSETAVKSLIFRAKQTIKSQWEARHG